jgi:hypothetical protein
MKFETDPQKIEEAIKRGQWIAAELHRINNFHKYRQIRQRYYVQEEDNDSNPNISDDQTQNDGEGNK